MDRDDIVLTFLFNIRKFLCPPILYNNNNNNNTLGDTCVILSQAHTHKQKYRVMQ